MKSETIAEARRLAKLLHSMGGPDLSYMTDDQLVSYLQEKQVEIASTVRKIGVSTDEAANSLRRLGAAFQRINSSASDSPGGA